MVLTRNTWPVACFRCTQHPRCQWPRVLVGTHPATVTHRGGNSACKQQQCRPFTLYPMALLLHLSDFSLNTLMVLVGMLNSARRGTTWPVSASKTPGMSSILYLMNSQNLSSLPGYTCTTPEQLSLNTCIKHHACHAALPCRVADRAEQRPDAYRQSIRVQLALAQHSAVVSNGPADKASSAVSIVPFTGRPAAASMPALALTHLRQCE